MGPLRFTQQAIKLLPSTGPVRLVGNIGLKVVLRYRACVLQKGRNWECTREGVLSLLAHFFYEASIAFSEKERG